MIFLRFNLAILVSPSVHLAVGQLITWFITCITFHSAVLKLAKIDSSHFLTSVIYSLVKKLLKPYISLLNISVNFSAKCQRQILRQLLTSILASNTNFISASNNGIKFSSKFRLKAIHVTIIF